MSVSPVRRSRKAAQKAVTKKRWIVSSSESEQEEQDVQDDESEVEVVTKTRKGGRASTRATVNGTKKKTNGKVITIDSSDGEAEDDDVQMEDGQVDPSSERPGGLESEPEITGPIGSRPYILNVEIETSRASGSNGPVKRTSTPGSSKKKIEVSAFLIKKDAPKPAARKDNSPSEDDDEEDEEPVKRGGRSSKSKPAPKTATKPSASAQSKSKPKPKRKVTSDSDSDFKIEFEHEDDDYAEPDGDEDHEVSSVEDLNDESEEEKPKKKSKSASSSTTPAASGLKYKPKSKSQSRAVSEEEEDDNAVDVESDAMSVVSEKKTVWKKKPAAKKSGKQPTHPVSSLSYHR